MAEKIIIITGSAPCVHDDLARLPVRLGLYDVMAIGLDAVDKYPGHIKYVATNHPEDIPAIRTRRALIKGNMDYLVISYQAHEGVDIVQPLGPVSGSSAILGALASIALGYDRIILCGCPLVGNAPEGNPYEAFRPGWEAVKTTVIGKIKSMSGWTREFLGGPPEVTIGACWDGRDYYSIDYINRLFSSVARNTFVPFDSVLYVGPEAEKPGRTDGIDPSITIIPVGLPFWWSGFVFWSKDPPGIVTPSILYLDLDQVIVGSLDEIITYSSEQAYMKDYPSHSCPYDREKSACVSTSLIRNGAGAKVWDEYVAQGKPVWDPLAPPSHRIFPVGCQSILDDPRYGMRYDLFPENWICSYRLQVLPRGLPDDCRIVAFHGRPKPHECKEQWIKEHWR